MRTLTGASSGQGSAAMRALSVDGRRHSLAGAREDHEERIALGALLVAAVRVERRPQERPMALAQLRVACGADALLEAGRALDVAEQEGRRPGRPRFAARSPGSGRLPAPAQWFGPSVTSAQAASQTAHDRQRDRRFARGSPPRSPMRPGPDTSSDRRRRPARPAAGRRGPRARRRSRRGPSRAMTTPSRMTRAPPLAMTKNPVPISPWRAMTWSGAKSTSTARAAIRSMPVAVDIGEQRSRRQQRRRDGPGSAVIRSSGLGGCPMLRRPSGGRQHEASAGRLWHDVPMRRPVATRTR